MANSNHSRSQNDQFVENTIRFTKFAFALATELGRGILEFRLPLFITIFTTFIVRYALQSHWDYALFFKGKDIAVIYPTKPQLYTIYYHFLVWLPALIWGTIRVVTKRNQREEIDTMFRASGVTNRLGQAPKHVGTYQREDGTNVMRVSAKGISVDDLKRSKAALEQSLKAQVDEFKPNLTKGTIDIHFSKEAMPEEYVLEGWELNSLRQGEFIVGKKKAQLIRTTLETVPHLLIAGETGGGKSTFLRQFITGLFLGDPQVEFTLIDLKAGLEFYLFRQTKRMNIITDLDRAIVSIGALENEINRRFRSLEQTGSRDIEQFNQKSKGELPRQIVVVDEVAELFLPGSSETSSEMRKARATLNRIARQGRALGMHLVVATQRPDSRSLDPQIKANLNGVLCFAMVNDASSISVLGNGKATELPNVKGRAIWKVGSDMTEVQTPFLDESITKRLLAPHKMRGVIPSERRFESEKPTSRFEPL